MIRALADSGVTVPLTKQHMDEADQLADRIAVIDHGRKIVKETSRELKVSTSSGYLPSPESNSGTCERAPVFRKHPHPPGKMSECKHTHGNCQQRWNADRQCPLVDISKKSNAQPPRNSCSHHAHQCAHAHEREQRTNAVPFTPDDLRCAPGGEECECGCHNSRATEEQRDHRAANAVPAKCERKDHHRQAAADDKQAACHTQYAKEYQVRASHPPNGQWQRCRQSRLEREITVCHTTGMLRNTRLIHHKTARVLI